MSHSMQPTVTVPKRKRSLPGAPDPDAEVVALSPRTLMATNRFVCEICKKGFQRDQNLQLHRRGHNLPWKLRQRSSDETVRPKRVYICPESSCTHHHPSRALGDLTGVKKHFSRKHGEKKWTCGKCTKRYAVLSDWKAHTKTCGMREYRCDCGSLFSRRDSFVTHRAFCDALTKETGKFEIPHILRTSCKGNTTTTTTTNNNNNNNNSAISNPTNYMNNYHPNGEYGINEPPQSLFISLQNHHQQQHQQYVIANGKWIEEYNSHPISNRMISNLLPSSEIIPQPTHPTRPYIHELAQSWSTPSNSNSLGFMQEPKPPLASLLPFNYPLPCIFGDMQGMDRQQPQPQLAQKSKESSNSFSALYFLEKVAPQMHKSSIPSLFKAFGNPNSSSSNLIPSLSQLLENSQATAASASTSLVGRISSRIRPTHLPL